MRFGDLDLTKTLKRFLYWGSYLGVYTLALALSLYYSYDGFMDIETALY